MAKKRLWLVMLAIALVFGMTVVGCEEEDEEDPTVDYGVIVNDIPEALVGENFTLTLIYGAQTVASTTGVVQEVIRQQVFDDATATGSLTFKWNKWNGVMTTKTGSPRYGYESYYISAKITIKIGSEEQLTSDTLELIVGNEHGYGVGNERVELGYTSDFN